MTKTRPLSRAPLEQATKSSEAVVPGRQPPAGRFGPIKTRRIFEEICDKIREQLVSGELKPGDRLPPERELAVMFAVSRTALREALRRLEMAGLIDLRKGSKGGAFILEGSSGLVTQSIRDMLDFGRASLPALLEARQSVQEAVLRIACERATKDDLAALARNIDETEELTLAGRFEERTFKAIEFNAILAKAARNEVLSAIVEGLSSVLRAYIALAGVQPHDPVVAARRRVLECLRARDIDGATETMRGYHESLRQHILKHHGVGPGKAAAASKRAPRRKAVETPG